MDKIRVIARALARTGKEEQLRNTLAGMLTPTRAEHGCRLYEESRDALDRHTQTPHYKQLAQNSRDLLEGAFEVIFLDSLG